MKISCQLSAISIQPILHTGEGWYLLLQDGETHQHHPHTGRSRYPVVFCTPCRGTEWEQGTFFARSHSDEVISNY